ncbi:MAG: hypothetical protein V7647_813 [Acidobacteriota bacterium]|jgi:hypothetical protein
MAPGRVARQLAAIALFTLLTAIMTWPQVKNLGTEASDHQDVYFNMWRFEWIAHAIATAPGRVLDGNIFYPERRTLTFSDAMPVESAMAAPLLWAGVRPVLVHNLMLLAGIVLSGAGMFALARRLTGSTAAGLTAGIVFAFAPYRFEHYMHMELQWIVWTPWAFWALHRMFETGSRRSGALVGLLVALQFMSSIYYGVFLATLLGLVAVLLLITHGGESFRQRAVALAITGSVCFAFVLPYGLQYAITKRNIGGRPEEQVVMFSAKPSSYAVATPTSLLYGERSRGRGRAERRLFPGLLPVLLAVTGLLLRRPSREAIAYVAGLVAAFELSLGMYGFSYPPLYRHVPIFEGLRAPARLGVYVLFFLALLAAYGHAALEQSLLPQESSGSKRRLRGLLGGAICAILILEYWVAPLRLVAYPNTAPPLHAWLARQPRGVVAELPLAPSHLLPGDDPRYEYLSTFHWMPSINGYSGYYPPSYLERVHRLQTFPDPAATRVLQRAGVQYVVVHLSGYSAAEVGTILYTLAANHAYTQLGRFDDGQGPAAVYRLH